MFCVPCPHHGQHYWQWCPVQGTPQTITLLQRCAKAEMATLCPAPGDLLAWDPVYPETPDYPGNWSLRKGSADLDPGEVAIGEATIAPATDVCSVIG